VLVKAGKLKANYCSRLLISEKSTGELRTLV